MSWLSRIVVGFPYSNKKIPKNLHWFRRGRHFASIQSRIGLWEIHLPGSLISTKNGVAGGGLRLPRARRLIAWIIESKTFYYPC